MLNMNPALLISRVVTLLIAFTCHEYSHALTAVLLGDNTPRRDGRLSLNPLRHLDLWGSILLIAAGFGYAKPVRVNAYAVTRRNKAGMMLVAAAGPFANLLLAIAGAALLRSGLAGNARFFGVRWLPSPVYFLHQFIWTNISLLVFNLIPLYPLDGEKVVGYFIPDSFRNSWRKIQSHGPQLLMLCFFVLPYLRIGFVENFISGVSYSLYQIIIGG